MATTIIDYKVLNQSQYAELVPQKKETKKVLHEAGTLWDQSKFLLPHAPQNIGDVSFPHHLGGYTRLLDLPIKTPHGKVIMPQETLFAKDFCQQVIDHVYSSMPSQYENAYAYLTIDEGIIPPHQTQRKDGLHVDGFQGERIGDSLPTDYSFIAWFGQGAPTKFYPYSFDTENLDRGKDNFSSFWSAQARQRNLKPVYARKNTIYGMDAYTVHESGINNSDRDIYRLFFRLSFSVREFDRLGNTLNPFLDLNWAFHTRNISDVLNAEF